MTKRTCVICGADLGKIGDKATYTGALIFGNKGRDPHVGPYCKDCGPPAIVKTDECVEDCPLVSERWIPVDGNCITKSKKWRGDKPKCEFSKGYSPFRYRYISCIHPAKMKKKVQSSRGKTNE